MAKKKEACKCYSFIRTVNDGSLKFEIGTKHAFTKSQIEKYSKYILPTAKYEAKYKTIAKKGDCNCKK